MLCVKCKKNQATNIYERMTDGSFRTQYYCAACYQKRFLVVEESGKEASVCSRCGRTAEDFLSFGLVGCEECYRTLSASVMPAVIRMQGREKHCGKTPAGTDTFDDLEVRRRELKAEVEKRLRERDFEYARKYLQELKEVNSALGKRGGKL